MTLGNFQILSDLHLETHPSYNFDFSQTSSNLALLGDIGHVNNEELFDFLRRQLRRFETVLFLFGNHEASQMTLNSAEKRVNAFASEMDQLQSSGMGKFVFLDQTRYDIDDHTTILGCTLYSRIFPEQSDAVVARMSDFRDILDWDAEKHVEAHVSDVAWLNQQVQQISRDEPDRSMVIFTHHSPSLDERANNPNHRGSEVTSGFVTDLSEEPCWRDPAVIIWAFGHTHYNCDFRDDSGKRIISNQKGMFTGPKETFQPSKVYEFGEKLVAADI